MIAEIGIWKSILTPDHEIQAGDEIDLVELLETVWRGRLLVMATGFIFSVLGGFYGSIVPVRFVAQTLVFYQSSGLKEFDQTNPTQHLRFNMREPLIDEYRDIDSQALLVTSDSVIREVIDDLDLQTDSRMHLPTSAVDVGWAIIRGTASISSDEALSHERLMRGLKKTVRVAPKSNSTILVIEANTVSPSLSADLANAFAEKYIMRQVDANVQEAILAKKVVDEVMQAARQEMEQARTDLRRHIFKSTVSISENVSDAGIAELANDFVNVSALVRSLITQQSRLETLMAIQDFDAISVVLQEGGQKDLESELRAQLFAVTNEQRRKTELQHLANPESQKLKEELDKFSVELRSLTHEQLENLVEEATRLEGVQVMLKDQLELAFYEANLSPELDGDLFVLQSQSAGLRENYLQLVELSTSLKLEARTQVPSSRIISTASVPVDTSSSGLVFYVATGTIIGLLLSVGLLLINDKMRGSVQGARALEQLLGVPRLSVIGKLPKAKGSVEIISENLSSPYVESLRRISREARAARVRCERTGDASGLGMVLVITSTVPNEGKSTTALGLAELNARSGQSVCLIDLALRDSGLSVQLGLKPNTSLNDYLAGIADEPVEKTLAKLATRSPLTVIGGSQLIGIDVQVPKVRDRTERLLDGLRSRFDLIIVDTSPLLSASEALTISQMGDVSLFIVRENFAQRSAVAVAWRELLAVHAETSCQPIVALSFVNKRSINHNYAHQVYGQTFQQI